MVAAMIAAGISRRSRISGIVATHSNRADGRPGQQHVAHDRDTERQERIAAVRVIDPVLHSSWLSAPAGASITTAVGRQPVAPRGRSVTMAPMLSRLHGIALCAPGGRPAGGRGRRATRARRPASARRRCVARGGRQGRTGSAQGRGRTAAAAAASRVRAGAPDGSGPAGLRVRGAAPRGALLRAVLLRLRESPARSQGQSRLLREVARRQRHGDRVGTPRHRLPDLHRRRPRRDAALQFRRVGHRPSARPSRRSTASTSGRRRRRRSRRRRRRQEGTAFQTGNAIAIDARRAETFGRLLDAMHEGVFVGTVRPHSGEDGATLVANPALKQLFGHPAEHSRRARRAVCGRALRRPAGACRLPRPAGQRGHAHGVSGAHAAPRRDRHRGRDHRARRGRPPARRRAGRGAVPRRPPSSGA